MKKHPASPVWPDGPCPCGRSDAATGRPLSGAACCGRYIGHFADVPAPDAESLMRSRYTAFVREDVDYLLHTWHADTRPPTLTCEAGVRWLGLEVRDVHVADACHAEVEFVARSRRQGRASRLHERSRFVREPDAQGVWRWSYVDGELS
ncbi:YchJ family protein [Brachymonas sp.]|uniref:YchJ family protein n=1 Tax=Brachymonas sp. TaxID=1936292 RepID=UPI0035B12FE5